MKDYSHYKSTREAVALCCDCGYAVKVKTMFWKEYKNTGLLLCRKCAKRLSEEINAHISKLQSSKEKA